MCGFTTNPDAATLLRLALEGCHMSKEQEERFHRLMKVLRGVTVDQVEEAIRNEVGDSQ